MQAHTPGGPAPLATAMSAATTLAQSAIAGQPDASTIVLVIGDGPASACNESNGQAIEAIGDTAQVGAPTHVVLVGGTPDVDGLYEAMAQAGGTRLLDYRGDENDVDEALAEVETAATPCRYLIDPPAPGVDAWTEVVLSFSGVPVDLPLQRVADRSACDEQPGFFVDDPAAPTSLELCPQPCGQIGFGRDFASVVIRSACP
ncbi:MAG: hypothetical protein AAGN82_15815 [Myxococcota bacterium]